MKDILFDLTQQKSIRVHTKAIKAAITDKVNLLTTKRDELLDELAKDCETPEASVTALVAVLDSTNTKASTIRMRETAKAVARTIAEIDYISLIARRLQDGDAVFYDLTIEDAQRFGL